MNWIRLDSGYPRHRKTLRLIRRLGPLAELYPIRLWLWAVEQAADGHLRDLDAEEVAMIVGHAGDTQACLAALLECGFLEGDAAGWRIRSWDEYQLPLIEQKAKAAERWRRWRDRKLAGEGAPTANGLQTVGQRDSNPATDSTDVTDKTRRKTLAPSSAPADSPPADSLLEFPTVGKVQTWRLSKAQVAEWATLYPGLDILGECRQALAWLRANPGRRKTTGGMPRFLVAWLGRAVNDGRAGTQSPAARRRSAITDDERERIQAGGVILPTKPIDPTSVVESPRWVLLRSRASADFTDEDCSRWFTETTCCLDRSDELALSSPQPLPQEVRDAIEREAARMNAQSKGDLFIVTFVVRKEAA